MNVRPRSLTESGDNIMRRITTVIVTSIIAFALALGGATAASAHTGAASLTCDTLAFSLKNYDRTATFEVIIDGKLWRKGAFGGGVTATRKLDPTVNHSLYIDVVSADGPQYNYHFEKAVECKPAVVVPPAPLPSAPPTPSASPNPSAPAPLPTAPAPTAPATPAPSAPAPSAPAPAAPAPTTPAAPAVGIGTPAYVEASPSPVAIAEPKATPAPVARKERLADTGAHDGPLGLVAALLLATGIGVVIYHRIKVRA